MNRTRGKVRRRPKPFSYGRENGDSPSSDDGYDFTGGIGRLSWLWALCIEGPMDSKGKPIKLIQGPFENSGEGMRKLSYDTTKIYPQGSWTTHELDTRDRARATSILRHQEGLEGGLETALRRHFKQPMGRHNDNGNQ